MSVVTVPVASSVDESVAETTGDMGPVEPAAGPPSLATPQAGLEVRTLAVDVLRASIQVAGVLSAASVPLLTSVLRAHVAAGRRYLRIDLDAALVSASDVVDALVGARRTIDGLGAMLVFDNGGPRLVDAIRNDHLFADPAS